MSDRMPVVFVSHGAPDALLKSPDTVACWSKIGRAIPEPTAILVVSAHWETRQSMVSLSGAPETIHDFAGFSPALHRMQYHAPGAPALAERVASLLGSANLETLLHPSRGLDHGAWIPLSVMYPEANIPVTQLSLARNKNAAFHWKSGKVLSTLRNEGVLIVASGAITHNFGWLDWQATDKQAPLPKAVAFTEWVAHRIAAQDIPALLDYRLAPYGAEAHPTEEHFLPLLVAMGAAKGEAFVHYQPRFAYGSLAMDAYLWQENTTTH